MSVYFNKTLLKMDPSYVSDGFRVQLNLYHDEEVQLKCFIFLNLKKMKCVRHVEEHVKSILELKEISLYVNDAWLPSNETVHIIKEDDIVVAKTSRNNRLIKNKRIVSDKGAESINRKRKRKDHPEGPKNISIELLYQELYEKRKALFQTSDQSDSEKLMPPENNALQAVDQADLSLLTVIKKKRIRKHKKKTVNKEAVEIEKSTVTPNLNSLLNPPKLPFGGKHTRFSGEVENNSATMLEQDDLPETTESTEVMSNREGLIEDKCLSKEQILPEETNLIPQIPIEPENQSNSNEVVFTEMKGDQQALNPRMDKDICTTENQEHVEEKDWKTKLLNLANNKEIESKIFYRKISTQDIKQTS